MNLWESILVAFESIRANKMRATLTMLGVIIGVAAVITMLAIAQGARDALMSGVQSLGTNVLFVAPGQVRRGPATAGVTKDLTLADVEALGACPSVAAVAPEVQMSAQVKYRNKHTHTTILGTSQQYPAIRNFTVATGRFFNRADVRAFRRVAVIGPAAAQDLFGGRVSPLGKTIRIKRVEFEIIGVLDESGSSGGWYNPDDQIIIPIHTAMKRVFGIDSIGMITVQTRSMEVMERATKEITRLLRRRHRLDPGEENDFTIRSQAELLAMANEFNVTFTLLLGGIASISLLVGGIGIMNIMLVSVTERTREIGIRMAMGARRRDIQFQFLIEAVVLSLSGGAIGILLGWLASAGLESAVHWGIKVTLVSVLLSSTFAALVGVFFGFYPARRASRLDPIEALRYE